MKGLIRKRSTTAARLQRAFSAKSLRTAANPAVSITPSGSSPGGSSEMVTDGPAVVSSPASNSSTSLTTPVKSPNDREKRQFIMETSVQFINVSFSSSFRMNFDNVLTVIIYANRDCRVAIGTCSSSTTCCSSPKPVLAVISNWRTKCASRSCGCLPESKKLPKVLPASRATLPSSSDGRRPSTWSPLSGIFHAFHRRCRKMLGFSLGTFFFFLLFSSQKKTYTIFLNDSGEE